MQDRGGGAHQSVGFNPFFKTRYGRGPEIGHLLVSLARNSTGWAPGSQIVVDCDGTYTTELLHDTVYRPGPDETMGWPALETIRPQVKDVTGAKPYVFTHGDDKEDL
mmetsp:Transcript_3488/g.9928  ORF Transcript_3488/g.9928 Transcript_3488/m.9928 type:complete len:107 (-) Transcript_3488:573-893(-)